jgi:nitroreductase/dihydropteridine reductase
MSLLESLKWRYATKRYNGKKLEQEKLDYILDVTQLATSSFGLQPYQIVVIQNSELLKKLVPAANNQILIGECSHLIVFAAWSKVTEQHIDDFIHDIAAKRETSLESLATYKQSMVSHFSKLSTEETLIWSTRQTYIALGNALDAAAEMRVDSTPMEGFNADIFDEELGFKQRGLRSSILMALGYRSDEDWLAKLQKVRRDKNKLIEFV